MNVARHLHTSMTLGLCAVGLIVPPPAKADDAPVSDAVSREFSLYAGDPSSLVPISDAVSREFSVYAGDPSSLVPVSDAVSREFSVYAGDPSSLVPVSDAVSREFSLYAGAPEALLPVQDAISREFSVYIPEPDLTIVTLDAPDHAALEENIHVSWEVLNAGDRVAAGPWQECLYLSADAVPGNDVALVCVTQPGSQDPGVSHTASHTFVTPNNAPGTYWLVLHVDTDQDVTEADEQNNFAVAGPIFVADPDLIAESITVQDSVAVGETVPLTWRVRNDGGGIATRSWTDCLYLSADDQIGDDLSLGCPRQTRAVASGDHYTGSTSVAIPDIADGTYWLVLKVDTESEIVGDDPANNGTVHGPITLTRADLQLVDITLPDEATPGEAVDIGWTVSNVGGGLAPAPWHDEVYLSNDSKGDGAIPLGGSTQEANLAAGTSYTRSATVTLPEVADGVYFVVVTADANSDLADPNRADNTRVAGSLNIGRPDLAATLLEVPPQADSGAQVTISWQVENHGALRTHHAWQDCVYLSTDKNAGNDTLVACIPRLRDLPVEESYVQTLPVQLPQVAEGFYWLYVVADGGEDLPESEESNNTSELLPITLATPNLVPRELTVPAVAAPSQQIAVTWRAENESIIVAAASWNDGIYLSTDATPGNDTLLGSFARPANLDAGASYNQSQFVTLPDIPEGQYWLVVQADDSHTLYESNETDNALVSEPFTVTRTDLAVTNLSHTPASPRSEGPVTVSWRVENASTVPTGHAWQDCIYLSTDAAIGNDTALGCFPRPNDLGSGEYYESERTVTLPALAAGSYWLVVAADGNAAVPEASESNNAQIIGPISVRLVLPPEIAPIGDDTLTPGVPYTGPTPVLLQGTPPVTWSLASGPAGMTIDQTTGVVSWPSAAEGFEPHLISIRATNEAGTAVASWSLTVPLTYTAYAMTDVNMVPPGTPIPLYGMATLIETGEPAPNKPVSVRVLVQGSRRVLNVTSDEQGSFSTVFVPLPREGGFYTVGADHPLVTTDKEDDAFSILSMGLSPETLKRQVTPGQGLTDTLTLKNNGDDLLTGLTYELRDAPAGLTATLSGLPATLGPRDTVNLTLTLNAESGAPRQNNLTLHVYSAEGASALTALSVEVPPLVPQVIATPGTLREGMVLGAQALVENTLTNIGGADSGALEISLPQADWLALVTPSSLPSLAPGESTGVTLSLTPDVTLDLGPYNGYYRVTGAQTNLTVPFTFTAVSDGIGDLRITVVDEFTFFADGEPKVEGAKIELSDPFTGEPVPYLDPDSGEPVTPVTGPDGSFTFHHLREGYYEVAISATGHDFHRGTYLVPRDGVEEVEVFLSRQLVSYTWNVVRTEIEDRYDISIDIEFETHVPAPVITIDPPFVDLIDMAEPVKQIDLTITNHGLIAADRANLSFDADPRYTILPLIEDLGSVPPLSSFVVPVVVYDSAFLAKNLSPGLLNRMNDQQKASLLSGEVARGQKDSQLPCSIGGRLRWFVRCGPYDNNYGVGIDTRIPPRKCGSTGGGPWTPRGCVYCVSGGGDGEIFPPRIAINKPIPCCVTGCASRGELAGETSVTAHAENACAGERLVFTLEGDVTDTGGATVDEECNETSLPGGGVQYHWVIETPYGTESGVGRVAQTIAAETGTYTCSFTAEVDRECAPAPKALGSAATTIERLVNLEMQGLAEESGIDGNVPNETNPGAYILLNNDLDNVTDPETINKDTKFDMDLDGPIDNEDDLQELSLWVKPEVEGIVQLQVPEQVEVYKDPQKGEIQDRLVWAVPEEHVPATLYIEGTGSGSGTLTLRIVPNGAKACEDEVEITVLEVALAIDGNWDREIKFDDPQDRKYLFWTNRDKDGLDSSFGGPAPSVGDSNFYSAPVKEVYEDEKTTTPNADDSIINTPRDLEDFTRIHLLLDQKLLELKDAARCAFYSESDEFPVPEASIFWAIDETEIYLQDQEKARTQAKNTRAAGFWNWINWEWSSTKLKDKNYFLLEGINEGKGRLVVQIKVNGTAIGKRTVFIDLKPIEFFYDSFRAEGDGRSDYVVKNPSGYESPENQYLLYVHGWNMGTEEFKQAWTHTIFKRMWWSGFKGKVGGFSWPSLGLLEFAQSEVNGFDSANALRQKLTELYARYGDKLVVLAHSQGNIVASEALKLANGTRIVGTYIATQAASPVAAYGSDYPSNISSPQIPDLNKFYPPEGKPYFLSIKGAATKFLNIFNKKDYALDQYTLEQVRKHVQQFNFPGYWYFNSDGDLSYNPESGDLFFDGVLTPLGPLFYTPLTIPEDRYRIFASIVPAYSGPLGHHGTTTVFESSWDVTTLPNLEGHEFHWFHSIQFRQCLADVATYWQKIMQESGFDAR